MTLHSARLLAGPVPAIASSADYSLRFLFEEKIKVGISTYLCQLIVARRRHVRSHVAIPVSSMMVYVWFDLFVNKL